jgi:hypothetical protein
MAIKTRSAIDAEKNRMAESQTVVVLRKRRHQVAQKQLAAALRCGCCARPERAGMIGLLKRLDLVSARPKRQTLEVQDSRQRKHA